MAVRLTDAPARVESHTRRPNVGGLHPEASLPSLRLVQPSHKARIVGNLLFAIFVSTPFVLALVPWRQSVEGAGRTVGFSPLDREFTVEAPISGRVRKWYVQEGSRVYGPRIEDGNEIPGDLIAVLTNNDPLFLEALSLGLDAIQQKLETAQEQVKTYRDIVNMFKDVRDQQMEIQRNEIEVAEKQVKARENALFIAKTNYETSRTQRDWYREVVRQGLISQEKMLMAEQKFQNDNQDLERAKIAVEQAEIDVLAKRAKLTEIDAKTLSDIAKVEADIQAAEAKVAEGRKELIDQESRIRNQQTQEVRAPRDGIIRRILINEGIQQVKDTDPIAILVPETEELAVELYLDGNDIPLVMLGDPVRLQFEGWPAVQFAGWPSVAVGTFAGKVAVIDTGDSGRGKFRVLVVPEDGEEWPSGRYLRQGAYARGWVLLRRVTLGYELWRRLNGFPPFVSPEEPVDAKGGGKGGYPTRLEPDPVQLEKKAKPKVPK